MIEYHKGQMLLSSLSILSFFSIIVQHFFRFIYLRERDSVSGEGAEREGERSKLHAANTEPDVGLQPTKLWDHDLSQNQESDA